MDRSFKNDANFKMNQQTFKLSDFGIDVKSGHEPKTAGQCKVRRGGQVSQVRQVPMGRNLLQVACNRSSLMTSSGSQHSPGQLGQLQSAAVDRFQTSSPSNLSIVQLGTSPVYWKQYGGQESGVNITRGTERSA